MAKRAAGVLNAVGSVAFLLLAFGLVSYVARGSVAGALVSGTVCLAAGAALAWVRFSPGGRRLLRENRTADWVGTFAVAMFLVGFATAGFAAWSSGLYRLGVGSIAGEPLEASDVFRVSFAYYLWHLLNAVPLLNVTETLNWRLEHPFEDSLHGALALVYVVLVAIPLVFIATEIVRDWLASEPSPESGPTRPDDG